MCVCVCVCVCMRVFISHHDVRAGMVSTLTSFFCGGFIVFWFGVTCVSFFGVGFIIVGMGLSLWVWVYPFLVWVLLLWVWVVSFFGVGFTIVCMSVGVVVPTRITRHASVLGHAVTALGAPHVRTHLTRWRCVCVCGWVGDCAWCTTRAHTPEGT